MWSAPYFTKWFWAPIAIALVLVVCLSHVVWAQSSGDTVNISATVLDNSTPPDDDDDGGGGGGGGGGGSSSGGSASVTFSGRAYPLSRVNILRDGRLVVTTIAGPDAKFSASVTGLSAGNYTFAVYGEDNANRRSDSFSFPLYITAGVSTNVSGIFLSPTIATDKAQVRRGDNVAIFGQSVPNGKVTIEVHSDNQLFAEASTDSHGVYLYNLDTAPLEIGQHLAKSKGAISGDISKFGLPAIFAVGLSNILANVNTACPAKGDLNGDCRVDLIDFSIAAFWYKRPLNGAFAVLESRNLNGDGVVDLRDFSILAYYWTG